MGWFSFWRASRLRRVQIDRPLAPPRVEHLSPAMTRRSVLLAIFFSMGVLWMLFLAGSPDLPRLLSLAVFVGIAGVFSGTYLARFEPRVAGNPQKTFLFGLVTLLVVGGACGFLLLGWPEELVPVTLVSMVFALGFSQRLAVAMTFLVGALVVLVPGIDRIVVAALIPGSLLAAVTMTSVRYRAKIIKVGALAGLVHVVMLAATHIAFRGETLTVNLGREALLGLANGLACGSLMTIILPFLERGFQITTDLSLLELADLNQPLLRKLALEAPGTFHHSLNMAALAEAAAEAIGANSLLCRVGAYYHDIGKMNKPDYFVENMPRRANLHKNLSPNMSTLIITAHVKDGLELAEYYGIPDVIQEFIPQHHGTCVVEYFYRGALERREETKGDQPRPESFRYPGPKPQSRETAIVLLADSVEAASRSLDEPSPARLEGQISDIAMKKLLDGQFDESSLSLKDLQTIKESFLRTLSHIYHSRVKYPGQDEDAAGHGAREDRTPKSESPSRVRGERSTPTTPSAKVDTRAREASEVAQGDAQPNGIVVDSGDAPPPPSC